MPDEQIEPPDDRSTKWALMSTRDRLVDDLAWDIESIASAIPLVLAAAIVALVVGAPIEVVLLSVVAAVLVWRGLVWLGRRIRRER